MSADEPAGPPPPVDGATVHHLADFVQKSGERTEPAPEPAPKAERSRRKPKDPAPDSAPGDAPPVIIRYPYKDPKNADGLWDDCPVQPLGVNGGDAHYLDALGQYRVLSAADHSRLGLIKLFAPKSGYLLERWPRIKDGEVKGFAPELAQGDMQDAAARKGICNPSNIRGPGAWRGAGDSLIWHCGDAILIDGQEHKPGLIDGYVYPAGKKLLRPAPAPDPAAIDELRRLLQAWNWQRDELAVQLLLGWIAAGMLGGALDWRPNIWITGDYSTGKSTLHDVLKHVMGPEGMIAVADTTAAGIYQKLGHSTLPVAVDELENETDNSKAEAVLKLARKASSGAVMLRGGSDHKGTEFLARACFMFSSILLLGLLPADRSRLAILELNPLGDRQKPPIDPKRLAEIGTHLRGRLARNFGRLLPTFNFYRAQLPGLSGRSADQFCTLLACADLALGDATPDDPQAVEPYVSALVAMRLEHESDELPEFQRAIDHLETSTVLRDGKPRTIGEWIHLREKQVEADEVLGAYGLKIIWQSPGLDEQGKPLPVERYLFVATAHQALAKLFENSRWRSPAGVSGVWTQALARSYAPLADNNGVAVLDRAGQPVIRHALRNVRTWLEGRWQRGTAVPWALVQQPTDAHEQQPMQAGNK
jgi:hypothetical protein